MHIFVTFIAKHGNIFPVNPSSYYTPTTSTIFPKIWPRVLNLLYACQCSVTTVRAFYTGKRSPERCGVCKGVVTGNHTILFRSHSCWSVWFIGKYSLSLFIRGFLLFLSLSYFCFFFTFFSSLANHFLKPTFALFNTLKDSSNNKSETQPREKKSKRRGISVASRKKEPGETQGLPRHYVVTRPEWDGLNNSCNLI